MQETQCDGGRFAKKIKVLRQRVLKMDGIEKVGGISTDIAEPQPTVSSFALPLSDKIFNTSQEQG